MSLRKSGRCFAYGRHGRTCDHARQPHHIVKRQHIRLVHRSLVAAHRRGGPAPAWKLHTAVKDRRLILPVCWAHHQLETSGKLRVEAADLPDGFWDAVREYGLQTYVPDHLTDPEED
jgi:hypothetical protein